MRKGANTRERFVFLAILFTPLLVVALMNVLVQARGVGFAIGAIPGTGVIHREPTRDVMFSEERTLGNVVFDVWVCKAKYVHSFAFDMCWDFSIPQAPPKSYNGFKVTLRPEWMRSTMPPAVREIADAHTKPDQALVRVQVRECGWPLKMFRTYWHKVLFREEGGLSPVLVASADLRLDTPFFDDSTPALSHRVLGFELRSIWYYNNAISQESQGAFIPLAVSRSLCLELNTPALLGNVALCLACSLLILCLRRAVRRRRQQTITESSAQALSAR
ncbi:MAG: hypothetical protein IBJ18_09260 [Phycisphaerales bacterium]|nr:hypothetical protein [Phycisphaerales bacterium]